MQRLFSTFANGWPGLGLLVLRLVAARALIISVASPVSAIPHIIGCFAGILLLAGLWTPVAGGLAVLAESWIILATSGDGWNQLLLGAVGGSLSLLGPGAWSLDARLFGRKRMNLGRRQPDLPQK